MARQEIILGTAPTGLGGDPPRTASTKINAMTAELYGTTPISRGGTGATDAGSARTNLGLGTASTRNIGTNIGEVVTGGTGGLFLSTAEQAAAITTNLYQLNRSLQYVWWTPLGDGSRPPGAAGDYGMGIAMCGGSGNWRNIIQATIDGNLHSLFNSGANSGGSWKINTIYTTQNTTRASDGTLKAI